MGRAAGKAVIERSGRAGGAAGCSDRDHALRLLKRYGWNATSFQVLEPGLRYWFDEPREACIAYVDTGRAWVVAGAPIAPEPRFRELVEGFARMAAAARRRVCYFGVERRFGRAVPYRTLPIGEQPVWDPVEWPAALRASRSLREQLRRARARGVVVRPVELGELAAEDASVRVAVEALIDRWLHTRPMAPMGFLVQVDLFSHPEERRLYVAEQNGRLVGFLAMVPVYARDGWLLEDLLRDAAAPNGTAELLIDYAMRAAGETGSRYATLGMAPLAGGVSPWLRTLRTLGARLYNFEGLRAFKAKLRPAWWEPIYLAFPPQQGALLSLADALAAFAPQGVPRFLLETMIRSPGPVLRGLALLLLPWMAALALADPVVWFPARWVQLAWIGFDALLMLGLLSLSMRWRQELATLLAVLITGDAMITLFEVGAFNLPRAASFLEVVVSGVAVLAPSLAALFLWAARAYQARMREASGPQGD